MFKNLSVFRLPAPFSMTADAIAEALSKHRFAPCGASDVQTAGWIAPRDGDLVHAVNRQYLIQLCTEKKSLPKSVVDQAAKARAKEIEQQQGFAPGRKQMKEIKEAVIDELLPRAFAIRSTMLAWIDPVNGWLVIDTASSSKADDLLKLLLKSVDQLPLEGFRTNISPLAAMTDWLDNDEEPAGFTIDQDAELCSTSESKATVRYVRHTLDADDMSDHIKAGKQCTKLALTWCSRISCVLTEAGTIKRVTPLDVLTENTDAMSKDANERFDGDFALMAGELNKMLSDLVDALGGTPVDAAFDPKPADVPATHISGDGPDPLYAQAATLVRKESRASISRIQRHLQIGYNRAARLIEQMEVEGVVGAMKSDGSRAVLKAA